MRNFLFLLNYSFFYFDLGRKVPISLFRYFFKHFDEKLKSNIKRKKNGSQTTQNQYQASRRQEI